MSKKNLTWVIIIFLLPALACSLGGGGDESASSNVSLGAEATEAPAPTEPPVVEDVQEVTQETPTPEPAEPESAPFAGALGLEQFDSFRANMFLEFTGAVAGVTGDETTSQRQDYLLEVTRNPQARHQITKIKGEGGFDTDTENEIYLVDDVTYIHAFDNWLAQAGAMGRSQFSNPEIFIFLPETAICDPEPERVGGISTIHCSFTEKDNISDALVAGSIQGDVWIAEDGNYIVKYEMQAQELDLKGMFGASGGYESFETYTLGYELSDVNAVTIDLPAEAQGTEVIDLSGATGGSSGLSAPEGADVYLDSLAGLNYFSTADIPTLVDFHRQALPAAGWQEIAGESYVGDNNALLIYENETGILRLFIFKDIDGGHFVGLTLPFETPGLSGGAGDSTAGSDAAPTEMPVLDDATELFSAAGITTYYTQSDVAAVIDFYRLELAALGWTENTTTSYSDENTGLLTFEQDGSTLTIAINKEGEGRVNVSLIEQ